MIKQVGEYSFEIGVGVDKQAAHASQLKLCIEVGEEEDLGDSGAVIRRDVATRPAFAKLPNPAP